MGAQELGELEFGGGQGVSEAEPPGKLVKLFTAHRCLAKTV